MIITTTELRRRYGLSRTEANLFPQREFSSVDAMDRAVAAFKNSTLYRHHAKQRFTATPAKYRSR